MNMVRQGLLILVGFSLAGSCASMEENKKRGLSHENKRENKKSKQLKKDINARDKDGETALIRACKDKNVKMMKELLDQGADPNIQNFFGETALLLASFRNYIEIAKLLLDRGADPTIHDIFGKETMLTYSCGRSNAEIVTLVVRHYWTLLTMNPEEKLTYVCRIDKAFRAAAENFLMSLQRNERETGLRMPKYLRFQMLLEAWRQGHPTDYRCALWFGTYEEKIEAFKAFLHAKNIQNKTALMLAQEEKKSDIIIFIITFLTALETALAQGEQAVREFMNLHTKK